MIDAAFARAAAEGRAAFIPYVMAGDPDVATTAAILRALAQAGADAVELGIPYGDPLADGPTITAAGQRALTAGATMADAFELVRGAPPGLPIVLFTYFNPVDRYGVERFARDAAAAGAAGAIVPDVGLEESGPLRDALAARGLAMPLLVAPTTPDARAAAIAQASGGFVYVVSRLGVTGAGAAFDATPVHAQIARLRALTSKPLAVGFGVSTAAHVRAVAPFADGVIVGSALIDAYAGTQGERAAERVLAFAKPLRDGTVR